MPGVLVDAGPLVALLNASDRHHDACRATVQSIKTRLWTVWPAVTEAAYLLTSGPPGAPFHLLDMLSAGKIEIAELTKVDAQRIGDLMRKYADLPMDLADAAIVRVGERDGIDTVFTLDRRDFSLYRPAHVRRFRLLP